MREGRSPDDDTAEYSLNHHIDQICDEFETAHKNGSNPKIEYYLDRVETAYTDRLLCELVAIDIEFVRRVRVVNFSEYVARFPGSCTALIRLQGELEELSPDQRETRWASLADRATEIGQPTRKPPPARFQSAEIVGQGGFSTVWKALDLVMQRVVAVKIPHSFVTADDMSPVLREAQAAAELRHPNIVFVHEVNELDGIRFIVTDYVDGQNLREWRRGHTVDSHTVAKLVSKLAMAIHHAHIRGVVHRDLKTSNVVMDESGEPRIADFGLAKREGRPDPLAIEGVLLGTLVYMAPEQARGEHDIVDRRTDVYALGVILYELLTGKLPFTGDQAEVLRQIQQQQPIPPRSLNPRVPLDLQAICLKCLAKKNDERYETAEFLADDLHRFLAWEPLQGVPTPPIQHALLWLKRRRRFLATICVTFVLCFLIGAGIWIWFTPPLPTRLVEITTVPAGCEITAVKLDDTTGDPDPTKIQHARGRTPLKMGLPPGDYLIVAVQDSEHFHEVFRHVPERSEKVALLDYRYWKIDKNSCVHFEHPITIPQTRIAEEMSLVKLSSSWECPRDASISPDTDDRYYMPSFYVDRQKTLSADVPGSRVRNRRFSTFVADAERAGKRLPTNLEALYLADTLEQISGDAIGVASAVSTAGLPIIDLFSLPWEWTSTKGFNLSPDAPPAVAFAAQRIARSGDRPLNRRINGETPFTPLFPFKLFQEYDHNAEVCARYVRSSRARTRQDDFPRRLDGPKR